MLLSGNLGSIEICVLLFSGLIAQCICWSRGLVSLELTSTGCEHSCVEYADDTQCSSSLVVNGQEKSHKKDGFNVAVIDSFSGNITTAHFRWSSASPIYVRGHARFTSFFKSVQSNSVIVILFQNMCHYLERSWYHQLLRDNDVKLHHLKNAGLHFIATVVACKKPCPSVVRGAIPYSYSGPESQRRFSTSISFRLGTASSSYGRNVGSNSSEEKANNIIMIVGVVVGCVVVAIATLACFLVYKRKRGNHQCKAKMIDQEEKANLDGPHYEDLEVIRQQNMDCNNIYVDPNDVQGFVPSHRDAPPLLPASRPSAPPLET